MKEYVFPNYDISKFRANLSEIVDVYNAYGVVIFPGFLKSDENYLQYIQELEGVFDDVILRKLGKETKGMEIGEKLTTLASMDPILGKIIAGLGTQHNKIFSFNKVKYAAYIEEFLKKVWGQASIIATPHAGDTLHLFPPGKKFHRYNLPPHQDYQYLMQSPRQITMYFGVSEYSDGVGGLRIWEKSHVHGILPSHKDENGAFEVHDWEARLDGHELHDFSWNKGDFGIFDSLLAHSSIPNVTDDKSRIVQIFRYSDLNNDISRSYDFGSTTYAREGKSFVEEHADLFVK